MTDAPPPRAGSLTDARSASPRPASDDFGPAQRTLTACLDALERSLRDPLRTIEGVGAAIASARSPDQQRHLLRAVNHAALMIERCSGAAIDLLRCRHGVLEPAVSVFTLRSLLHEVRIAAHSAQTRARPSIELIFAEHDAVIRGDRPRLVRVAAALLCAVSVANEEGGAIILASALRPLPDDLVEVHLRVGLPQNSKEPLEVANSFNFPDDSAPLRSAEHLESYSAGALAARLGVTFSAVEVPRSVLIRFTCPLVALRPRAPASSPVRAVRPAPVLLVDTPTHRLRTLQPALSESGYQPVSAHHLDDAFAILLQHAPAAILVAADGQSDAPLQFARRVRTTSRTATIPIVLVARALDAPQLALARRCVDSVLVAPVCAADAVRHLNGWLRIDRRTSRRPLELY